MTGGEKGGAAGLHTGESVDIHVTCVFIVMQPPTLISPS